MKNRKKLTFAIALLLLAALLAGTAAATTGTITKELAYRDIKIRLNGETLTPRDGDGAAAEPFIIDGTTYLPLRAVASALGLDVDWDGATSTVILESPDAEKDVYITRTGSKYHYNSTCNGGTYWPVPYDTAAGMGLEPCDKCVHD